MPKTYDPAPAEVLDAIRAVMRQHHQPLVEAGVTLGALMVGGGLSLHGYPAMAVVRVNSLKERSQGKPDAHIDLAEEWSDLSSDRQCAVLDHELEHLSLVIDLSKKSETFGLPKRDDRGRPKLKLRRHDLVVGGFTAVLERHGATALESDHISYCGRKQAEILHGT